MCIVEKLAVWKDSDKDALVWKCCEPPLGAGVLLGTTRRGWGAQCGVLNL